MRTWKIITLGFMPTGKLCLPCPDCGLAASIPAGSITLKGGNKEAEDAVAE
ncbi:MAG: hypothetical protein JRI80_00415 [Deltaproteobacteria bacterium]|nr:hypothetical protein [Deltaproteobacteria bacterium]